MVVNEQHLMKISDIDNSENHVYIAYLWNTLEKIMLVIRLPCLSFINVILQIFS